MGCHTWSYAKITAIPEKEKQIKVNDEIESLENWWGFKESFNNVVKEVNSWKKDKNYSWIKDKIKDSKVYTKNMIQEFTDKLNNLKEKGFDAYLEQKKDNSSLFRFINGEYYMNVGFDDPFRVYGYPSETFTDKEELLKWLQTLQPQMYGYYPVWEEGFFEGYSDELVQKIDDFFNKYGEDNCYIEFG